MRLIAGVFTWELTMEELILLNKVLKNYAYTQQVVDRTGSDQADSMAQLINRTLYPH
jgi:hypothetical protein